MFYILDYLNFYREEIKVELRFYYFIFFCKESDFLYLKKFKLNMLFYLIMLFYVKEILSEIFFYIFSFFREIFFWVLKVVIVVFKCDVFIVFIVIKKLK